MIDTILCDEKAAWDKTVAKFGGHPLQLWGWGEVKAADDRSEERRVGKECRSRWSPYH